MSEATQYLWRVDFTEYYGVTNVATLDPQRWAAAVARGEADTAEGESFHETAQVHCDERIGSREGGGQFRCTVGVGGTSLDVESSARKLDVYGQAIDVARFIENCVSKGDDLPKIGERLRALTPAHGEPTTERFDYDAAWVARERDELARHMRENPPPGRRLAWERVKDGDRGFYQSGDLNIYGDKDSGWSLFTVRDGKLDKTLGPNYPTLGLAKLAAEYYMADGDPSDHHPRTSSIRRPQSIRGRGGSASNTKAVCSCGWDQDGSALDYKDAVRMGWWHVENAMIDHINDKEGAVA
jgi:hypothetical protein